MIDRTKDSKEYLKSIVREYVYDRYIDERLAGDFACNISEKIKELQAEIKRLRNILLTAMMQTQCSMTDSYLTKEMGMTVKEALKELIEYKKD